MVSAAIHHIALLRSDGHALAVSRFGGKWHIPELRGKHTYVQVSAGNAHTALLCSDGSAVAVGFNTAHQCEIPQLDGGVEYVQVAAGLEYTVLLRSDGRAVACGNNVWGQCDIPEPASGVRYVQASASFQNTVLLCSDGSVTAIGENNFGTCTIPALDEGVSYTQVSAGGDFTALLRSDGTVVLSGEPMREDIPEQLPLPEGDGIYYTQVSASPGHVVALRSDGSAIAFGRGFAGECKIPALPAGLKYVQVSAGAGVTALLRSDGKVVTTPAMKIPLPAEGMSYAPGWGEVGSTMQSSIVLQLQGCPCEDGAMVELVLTSMGGGERGRLVLSSNHSAAAVNRKLALHLELPPRAFQVVLPSGKLLQLEGSRATLASVLGIDKQPLTGRMELRARSRSPALRRRMRRKTAMPLPYDVAASAAGA